MSDLLEDVKRAHVLRVYAKHSRNKVRTARALGVCVKSLYAWLKNWGET